ncbi:choice-of-anchor B family protein [Marinicella litoralis]|uniref:Choice-of-anchor B domain-containing protein n=1 Tax=Marinicella litoralis TaxID=644220 RepID=A0A4R6XSK7_9GAMM|nr:choice-of-anchor B family protein [Marinicella litoralis]TDR19318.1 choice-of-anchor B domain-containing protein [Marinicella litoralis]
MSKKIAWIISFFTPLTIAHPFTECINGMADFYACNSIDLLHRIHLEDMGTGNGSGNDIWGWTDPLDGKEYALMGLSTGTAFVDISIPTAPVYLGHLSTATGNSSWRDIKTYNNHAYIVSEASGHGMQIFDLTQLRNVPNPPVDFTATANYTEFGNAHNIVINEDSGFAYAVGANCSGGLHMMDLTDPVAPTNEGCFSADGYTHDAQCVMYVGPDVSYVGQEICFNSNENTLTIVDVSDKSIPRQISRTPYTDSRYTHQGWLTEDQRYYLMNDELDEQNFGHNTKTYIWDLADLETPQIVGSYIGPEASIDHNLYIRGNFAYLSNYTSGLSVVEISDIGNGNLTEVANFDTYPSNNNNVFNGAWSNYPYFASGNVIVSDISGGLFILDPLLCPTTTPATDLVAQASGDNSISLTWTDSLEAGESYNVYRSEGGCAADNFIQIADQISDEQFTDLTASGLVDIGYKVSKVNAEGVCESARSTCSEAQTTGVCTAAPAFNGISSVVDNAMNTCSLTVNWSAASSYCGSPVAYNVYRSTDEAFEPGPTNLVATEITDLVWTDYTVLHEQNYHYLVKSIDVNNAQEDNNSLKMSNQAYGNLTNGVWSVGAETGDSGLGQATRHLGWELITDQVFNGERSYWSQNENNACNQLTSDPLDLTEGQASVLSFNTLYDIESRYDGGLVEISVADGPWLMPDITPTYPDTFRNTSDQCGYTENTPAFSGSNGTWQQHTMDLSAYNGQDVRIRFSYSTDGSVNNPGWYLDDVAMTHVQVPGFCETLGDVIYIDGFD